MTTPAINLYASQNPLAEIVLAKLWKESARTEKHQRALPPGQKPVQQTYTLRQSQGVCFDVCTYAEAFGKPFTRSEAAAALPQYTSQQVASALLNATIYSRVIIVGKTHKGQNIYEWSGK